MPSERAFARSLDAMLTAAGTGPALDNARVEQGRPRPGAGAVGNGSRTPGSSRWRFRGSTRGSARCPSRRPSPSSSWAWHAVPGPVVETVAAAALLDRLAALGEPAPAERFLPALASGTTSATLTLPDGGPYAVDPQAADLILAVSEGGLRLAPGHARVHGSLDPALTRLTARTVADAAACSVRADGGHRLRRRHGEPGADGRGAGRVGRPRRAAHLRRAGHAVRGEGGDAFAVLGFLTLHGLPGTDPLLEQRARHGSVLGPSPRAAAKTAASRRPPGGPGAPGRQRSRRWRGPGRRSPSR
ncbi:hypothetical protein SALBM135S_01005 [Streptomyces alboniger]